jgi:iron-sulfur cluster repair protein YtfE (RIC family)
VIGTPLAPGTHVMLTSIRTATDPRPADDDLVGHLLVCHERIRRFVALARRLAEADGAAPSEVTEAARAVHRYFTVALPLHKADEDESIRPRLLAAAPPAPVVRAVEGMTDEHERIDEVLAAAAPLWAEVASRPERVEARRAELAGAALALEVLFRHHLDGEEEIVFPAIARHLTPTAQAEVRAEMRRRRNPEGER